MKRRDLAALAYERIVEAIEGTEPKKEEHR